MRFQPILFILFILLILSNLSFFELVLEGRG
jgi:hypothetical protein